MRMDTGRRPAPPQAPPWGTPEAKRLAREELQRRIEAQRRGVGKTDEP